ncbi:MAG: hypothetical protein R3E39_15640 [Anaerolineae bacterium]
MSLNENELRQIRREVDRRLLWRGLLLIHTVLWIFGGTLSILLSTRVGVPFTISWFAVLVMHWLVAGLMAKRERDFQREVERRRALQADNKLKRDRLYRLSEDGELEEVGDDMQDYASYQQQR